MTGEKYAPEEMVEVTEEPRLFSEVNKALVGAMGENLARVFLVGTKRNGDLYAASSGTEEEALRDIAEFALALSKGAFNVE